MITLDEVQYGAGKVLALALVAVAALTLVAGGSLQAQMPVEEGEEGQDETAVEDADFVIGTFNQQQVFTQYPEREKMMEESQNAQKEMQDAQQEGDNQKVQQIQQELQEKQQKIIQDFQDDIKDVLGDVADDAGVNAVAIEVQHSDDNTATKDVTDDVIEALGGDPDDAPQMEAPGR